MLGGMRQRVKYQAHYMLVSQGVQYVLALPAPYQQVLGP